MSKSIVFRFFNTVYTNTNNLFYIVIFLFYFLEKTRTQTLLDIDRSRYVLTVVAVYILPVIRAHKKRVRMELKSFEDAEKNFRQAHFGRKLFKLLGLTEIAEVLCWARANRWDLPDRQRGVGREIRSTDYKPDDNAVHWTRRKMFRRNLLFIVSKKLGQNNFHPAKMTKMSFVNFNLHK